MIGLKIEKVRAGRGLGTVGVQEPHLEGDRMAHWVVPESETNMKKLMFAASAAICAAVGFANMDGVQSNNIVGYNTTALEAGKFVIGAAQFEDVESGVIDLQKVISGLVAVDYDDASDFVRTAPQIQIQGEGGILEAYYYLSDAWVEGTTYVEGWASSSGAYVDLKVVPGTAFWIKTVLNDAPQVVSGAVCGEDAVEVIVPQNAYKLIANAFPMPISLNGGTMQLGNIKGVDYDGDSKFVNVAPQIQVQNDEGVLDIYYYLNDGYIDGKYVPGWCSVSGVIQDVNIPVGRGFWMKGSQSEVTVTFVK